MGKKRKSGAGREDDGEWMGRLKGVKGVNEREARYHSWSLPNEL